MEGMDENSNDELFQSPFAIEVLNGQNFLSRLACSENVDEEAVEQWINEDSTLECCEAIIDDDIVSRVTCGSEETRNFEECPESDVENLVTHQKS
ncbi:hypothetical protein AVEN_109927-1, partial [Araneus ventricosus]